MQATRLIYWCEGCGTIPSGTYALKRFWLPVVRGSIMLCWDCQTDVSACRPYLMPFNALLEELAEHRFRNPRPGAREPYIPSEASTPWRNRA